MVGKAFVVLSIFFMSLSLFSSDVQLNLRYRPNSASVNHVYGLAINGKVVPENKVVKASIVPDNRFNGIVELSQNQDANQEDSSLQCSDYICPLGIGLGAYWFTGSGCLGAVTPLAIAVAANCICPQAME